MLSISTFFLAVSKTNPSKRDMCFNRKTGSLACSLTNLSADIPSSYISIPLRGTNSLGWTVSGCFNLSKWLWMLMYLIIKSSSLFKKSG